MIRDIHARPTLKYYITKKNTLSNVGGGGEQQVVFRKYSNDAKYIYYSRLKGI